MHYQSHDPNAPSMSDSANKLKRLQLPDDLTGARLLDIGCSEGFFCNVAAQRGAVRVVGIELLAKNLEVARTLYDHPAIEFLEQSWKTLPDGPFDIVLWTSAMHYELDPKRVLNRIHDILSPSGKLILECGLAPGDGCEMVMSARAADTLWYPTERHLLQNLLENFSTRCVAWSELTPGDPLPRSVYHCQRRLPNVLLVRGESYIGKSTVAAMLTPSATQVINLDKWIYRVQHGPNFQNAIQTFIRDNADMRDLTSLYPRIDAVGLTKQYAQLLSKSIAESDRLVVIEGLMTDAQMEALVNELRGRAIVWDAARRRPGLPVIPATPEEQLPDGSATTDPAK